MMVLKKFNQVTKHITLTSPDHSYSPTTSEPLRTPQRGLVHTLDLSLKDYHQSNRKHAFNTLMKTRVFTASVGPGGDRSLGRTPCCASDGLFSLPRPQPANQPPAGPRLRRCSCSSALWEAGSVFRLYRGLSLRPCLLCSVRLLRLLNVC